jgi:glycosyltransferase involved in cell wall biosynthesis
MKQVYLANESRQTIGGGWSFLSNLKKGLGEAVTDDYASAGIVFISGASMAKPEVAEQAKRDGKKVVLRVDNALKHSRNGGKGMARMQRIAAAADLVVYQCQWAKDYLHDYLGYPSSVIIYNGVDLDVFTPDGPRLKFSDPGYRYLFCSAAKNETKRWEWAWWHYQMVQKLEPLSQLLIAGNISTPVKENNFDFFNDERYLYLGMVRTPAEMAIVYRSCKYLYATFENDCYSNTYLEALACGVELIETSLTGGTPELLENWQRGREYNGIQRMLTDYVIALEKLNV